MSIIPRKRKYYSIIASPAFTIVELLVVIVVIGILATITIVAYTGISSKASEASVIADLSNTNKQFKLFQVENSGYPTTIDCAQPNSSTNKCIKPSTGNTFGVFYSDNTTSPQVFCLTIKGNGAIKKNINQDGVMADGACTFAFAGTLTATVASRVQINLTWTNISGATNYEVQKDINSSFSSPSTVYTGSGTAASSTSLTKNTAYYYRVRATVDGDVSNWSSMASATTPDFPVPATFAMNAKTSTSVGFTWAAVSGATGYTLQRSSSASFATTTDYNIVAPTTTQSITGLTAGGYYYRVRAYDAIGPTDWTKIIASFDYIGSPYTLTVPSGATSVTIEAWGAQGGSVSGIGGNGGYAKGTLSVAAGSSLYVYVGGAGLNTPDGNASGPGGYNGGGTGGPGSWTEWITYGGAGGGGASDVRYGGNTITPTDYRKIVAGGGGGGGGYNDNTANQVLGGYGGGVNGANGAQGSLSGGAGGVGGTATTGFAKGTGQTCSTEASGGGGGGYYGGGCGGPLTPSGGGEAAPGAGGGGGGSGYITGLSAPTALTAGNASMPTPAGGTETGHTGHGYIRIIIN